MSKLADEIEHKMANFDSVIWIGKCHGEEIVAALRAAEQSALQHGDDLNCPKLGNGYITVPVEPTEEMLRAGHKHIAEEIHLSGGRNDLGINPELWRSMLAAAPAEPSRDEVLESAANICANLAGMMESGAGEIAPGFRLRQAEKAIRALKSRLCWPRATFDLAASNSMHIQEPAWRVAERVAAGQVPGETGTWNGSDPKSELAPAAAPSQPAPTPRDCKHGQLARSCGICELERELAAANQSRDEWVTLYTTTKRELAAAPADYQRIVREVLACNPNPASSRADDQLEPPWEVIARVRIERDTLQARLEQEQDIRGDREGMLKLLADTLGVIVDPHQTFDERLLATAQSLQARIDAPMPREDWILGLDGRLHCPCCFAAEKKLAAAEGEIKYEREWKEQYYKQSLLQTEQYAALQARLSDAWETIELLREAKAATIKDALELKARLDAPTSLPLTEREIETWRKWICGLFTRHIFTEEATGNAICDQALAARTLARRLAETTDERNEFAEMGFEDERNKWRTRAEQAERKLADSEQARDISSEYARREMIARQHCEDKMEAAERRLAEAEKAINYLVDHQGHSLAAHQAAIDSALAGAKND